MSSRSAAAAGSPAATPCEGNSPDGSPRAQPPPSQPSPQSPPQLQPAPPADACPYAAFAAARGEPWLAAEPPPTPKLVQPLQAARDSADGSGLPPPREVAVVSSAPSLVRDSATEAAAPRRISLEGHQGISTSAPPAIPQVGHSA